MNEVDFVEAYAKLHKGRPFSNWDKFNELRSTMIESAFPEHKPEIGEFSYGADQARCACGWESRIYWDGFDFAEDEWREHVINVLQDFR